MGGGAGAESCKNKTGVIDNGSGLKGGGGGGGGEKDDSRKKTKEVI